MIAILVIILIYTKVFNNIFLLKLELERAVTFYSILYCSMLLNFSISYSTQAIKAAAAVATTARGAPPARAPPVLVLF